MIGLYVAACAYYTLSLALGGHGESSVLCTAWEFSRGAALYPAIDAAPRYAMVYGPMSAAWPALLFWLFGPHVLVVKVFAGLMALAGFACCWLVYRRIGGPVAALAGAGWLALVYLKYTIITYYVRPDTPLQLCMSLALLATLVLRRHWAWIVLGVAIAWGIDLKITMPVYVLPLLVLFWQRHGLKFLAAGLTLAAVLAIVPFLAFPQVSAWNYFQWLTTAVDEGTERGMIIPVGGYLGLLSVPVLCVVVTLALREPAAFKELARRYRWFGACAALSLLAVLRITGKPGAGPSHLLPLFPILGVVLVKALSLLRQRENRLTGDITPGMVRVTGTGVVFLLILVGFAVKGACVDVFMAYPWKSSRDMMAEVTTFTARYPGQGMSMGVGSSRENYYTFRYQPALVLRGNPYILDVPAMMDMQKAGRAIPQATRDYMVQGQCPLWLIPRGEEPFELRNWYDPNGMIFDDAFRRVFHAHYRIVDHSEHFDVWAYQE